MEEPIKCVAVDDEAPALRIIEQYVSRIPSLVLAAQFRDPVKAALWLANNGAHILFLDIQMPQQSGIAMLQALPSKPLTIFTTAYSEFAADAFDLDAVDYLRKPFSFERFSKAIEKAKDYLQISSHAIASLQQSELDSDFITIKADGRIVKIYFPEILYVEGFQEYIKVYTTVGRYITYERMKNMEAILPASNFMRVHKSYIVALNHVKSISGHLLQIGEHQIPVSRELKEQVVKKVF